MEMLEKVSRLFSQIYKSICVCGYLFSMGLYFSNHKDKSKDNPDWFFN